MPRKYKFFVKESAVIVGSDADGSMVRKGQSTAEVVEQISRIFEAQELETNVQFQVADVEEVFRALLDRFRLIVAAGGYVLNGKGELLMIYRRGFWDLPKGKLAPGESIEEAAVREVEEECQVSGLSIASDAFETFHIYSEKGQPVIKQSCWFLMKTAFVGDPIPQEEEDIAQAVWITLPVSDEMRSASYASIREVLDHFSV